MSTRISDEKIRAELRAIKTSRPTEYDMEFNPGYKAVAEAQRKHSDREEAQLMINRANVGLDALTEHADPFWRGYCKGLKDYGQAKLKEILNAEAY